MKGLKSILAFALAVAATACKGVPSYVIAPGDMASLLADMHTAEAVIDMHYNDYSSDSAKKQLKDAIYLRHRVTPEQFDTSLDWYAHNIDKYIGVYDEVIEILDERNVRVGHLAAREALSLAGDSVNVWGSAPMAYVTRSMPSSMITFDLPQDDNWEMGDMYTWRVKVIDAENPEINWGILANYSDSTVEYLNISTSRTGWNAVTFIADSAKQLTRLRGFFQPSLSGRDKLWVDSISLVRKRLIEDRYRDRFRQRAHKQL